MKVTVGESGIGGLSDAWRLQQKHRFTLYQAADYLDYDHPIFDQLAIDAQSQLGSIEGHNRTWYCGAWCDYRFHADRPKSALRLWLKGVSLHPNPSSSSEEISR